MTNKKKALAFGGAVLATAAIFGVNMPAVAANQTITIWLDNERGKTLSPVLDGNTSILSGYKLEVKTYASRDAMLAAWDKASAVGGPDVMMDAMSTITSAGKNGKALPIVLSATNKAELPVAALRAMQYQGVQYGIPLDVDTTTMYWNTKFGKAPKTFKELAATFLKYKKAGKVTTGICAGDGTWGAHPVLTALGGGAWGYKADGVTPDATKVLFNSATFVKNANELLIDSKTKKGNGLFAWDGWSGCGQTFLKGKALAVNTGSWNLSNVINAGINYTLQPVPTYDGKGTSRQWSGFGGVFGTTFAKEHGVELGVKSLLAYFASQKGALLYADTVKRPPVNSKLSSHLSPDVAGFANAAKTGLVQENALLDNAAGGANWFAVLDSTFTNAFTKGLGVKTQFDKGAAILKKNFADGITKR